MKPRLVCLFTRNPYVKVRRIVSQCGRKFGTEILMFFISYDFQERSEGADEILIWIPQTSVAIGSLIFFIAVLHKFILTILNKND